MKTQGRHGLSGGEWATLVRDADAAGVLLRSVAGRAGLPARSAQQAQWSRLATSAGRLGDRLRTLEAARASRPPRSRWEEAGPPNEDRGHLPISVGGAVGQLNDLLARRGVEGFEPGGPFAREARTVGLMLFDAEHILGLERAWAIFRGHRPNRSRARAADGLLAIWRGDRRRPRRVAWIVALLARHICTPSDFSNVWAGDVVGPKLRYA